MWHVVLADASPAPGSASLAVRLSQWVPTHLCICRCRRCCRAHVVSPASTCTGKHSGHQRSAGRCARWRRGPRAIPWHFLRSWGHHRLQSRRDYPEDRRNPGGGSPSTHIPPLSLPPPDPLAGNREGGGAPHCCCRRFLISQHRSYVPLRAAPCPFTYATAGCCRRPHRPRRPCRSSRFGPPNSRAPRITSTSSRSRTRRGSR